MKPFTKWAASAVVATALGYSPLLPQADILVGQTGDFSGPASGGVKEMSMGAALLIDDVNRHGGVNGQPVRLIQLDDRFDPKLAAHNAETLIVDDHVVALFLARGTPHNQAILPVLAKYRIAMVAPSTGALALRQPVNPYVFNVRATYQREAEHAIIHLGTVGLSRIAVLHVDDSFGQDALVGAGKGFAQIHVAPRIEAAFDRAKPDFGPVAPRIAAEAIQAVLIIGSADAVVKGTTAIRAAGSRAQIVTLSNNASESFVQAMGANAYGTLVSQVFPPERSLSTPVSKEASDLATAKGLGLTPSMMEGFVGAKVLVEGLRRAGNAPTRESVVAALDGMSKFNLGGMVLTYAPNNHSGLDYVDLSIISPTGKFER
jgi:ABC-type branched-subunit amino acid transport system substrate-binding protein